MVGEGFYMKSFLLRLRSSHSCWTIRWRVSSTDSDHWSLCEHHSNWLASSVMECLSSLHVFFCCLYMRHQLHSRTCWSVWW